jgi:carbamoylphosphate synthase large subunit
LPRLQSGQPLEKTSTLAHAATHYKVDPAQIGTAVGAELSRTKNKATKHSQPTNKPTIAKSARHKRSKWNWITKAREAQVSSLASRLFALLRVQFIPTLLESSNINSL